MSPGSICSAYHEQVFKGMHMAGRMSHDRVTVTGLKDVVVDAKLCLRAISGAVPGPKRGLVMVRGAL